MARPERPSRAKVDVERAAAEMRGEPPPGAAKGPQSRFCVRMHPDSHQALRVAAVTSGRSLEQWALDAFEAYGATLHPNDKGAKAQK